MAMENIKHIVYVMMENRSMDSVLGWLYDKGETVTTIGKTPPNYKDGVFEGLHTGDYYNLDSNNKKVPATQNNPVGSAKPNQQIPSVDPHEEFEDVQKQIATSKDGHTMSGFYKNFATVENSKPKEIMECYTPKSLPILNWLAKEFAVSDAYFSSIPTQTNCNRAFSLTGNSIGYLAHLSSSEKAAMVNNHWDYNPSHPGDPFEFTERNIWNVIDKNHSEPSDWMIYYSQAWPDIPVIRDIEHCFTEDLLWPTMSKDYGLFQKYPDHVAGIDKFFKTLENNDPLPKFSYIEPKWYEAETYHLDILGEKFSVYVGHNGQDYHPPGNVGNGEIFLHTLYQALSSSANWENTLLIINFDEHGGTYDHVEPSATVNAPWENIKDGTKPPKHFEVPFDFKKLGVRVPLILVSPLIEGKTVFRSDSDTPFDHTSVIATILNWFKIDSKEWQLGSRTANAPTFENIVTLQPNKARKKIPAIPNPIPTSESSENVAPSDLQLMIMHRYIARAVKRKKYSKTKFNELYKEHFKDISTMKKLNEAANRVFNLIEEQSQDTIGKAETSPSEKASAVFKKELDNLGLSYHEGLYNAIIKYLGPSIHHRDASLVACSDPKELASIKTNFLIGKLGMEDGPNLDKVIQEVCHGLGQSNRNKHRATFYYLLVAILKKESIFI